MTNSLYKLFDYIFHCLPSTASYTPLPETATTTVTTAATTTSCTGMLLFIITYSSIDF